MSDKRYIKVIIGSLTIILESFGEKYIKKYISSLNGCFVPYTGYSSEYVPYTGYSGALDIDQLKFLYTSVEYISAEDVMLELL